MVVSSDADPRSRRLRCAWFRDPSRRRHNMYVLVQHRIKDPQTAFSRGEKLMKAEGAPTGARNLQFYPSRDLSTVTCLWEAPSVSAIQGYVDAVLTDSSENTCYEVDSEQAYARLPLGIRESAGSPKPQR
jgi:hypothetical protein